MTADQATKRIAELELQLQQITLAYSIQNQNDEPIPVKELASRLNCEFFSDTLILAVLQARPDPINRHTSPTAPMESPELRAQQRHMVYYTKEFLDYTEYACDAIFEPHIHVIVFRAEQGIGLLFCPNPEYVLVSQFEKNCPERLIHTLHILLSELDKRFGFENLCTVSAPHSGTVSLYEMYQETKHAASYSWNLSGNLHAYQDLQFSPLSPEEQVTLNHLEREFAWNIEQLLFFEAAAVLDRILDLELTHAFPVTDVITGTTARLRNVVAVAEALTDITPEGLMQMDQLVYNTGSSVSIPEFRDRIHDFFVSMADYGPRQTLRKSQLVLEFIEANYKNPSLGAQMICDRFRISQTYLSRLIRQETGTGLVDTIHALRVSAAKHLLAESDLGIEPIALQVGFSNRYSLVRAFKHLENTTPDSWRRNNRLK